MSVDGMTSNSTPYHHQQAKLPLLPIEATMAVGAMGVMRAMDMVVALAMAERIMMKTETKVLRLLPAIHHH